MYASGVVLVTIAANVEKVRWMPDGAHSSPFTRISSLMDEKAEA